MHRHHLTALVAVTVVVGLLPAGAAAQTIIIPPRGQVLDGRRGTADELELTAEEAAMAFSASSGLTVGIVMPSPDQVPDDFDVSEIVAAITRKVEAQGARVVPCDAPTVGAAACIDEFVNEKAAGFVIIGSQGDLIVPTQRAVDQGVTYPVSIGDSTVAPQTVVIDSDPVTRAYEQGRTGGAPLGVPMARNRGSAIIASAVLTGQPDPATDAEAVGLLETAPKAKVMAVLGPPVIETTQDLVAAVAQLPPSGILIGEGVKLTQATAEGLEALPATLRVIAYQCTPSLKALIDLGSRIRGCIERSNEGAGETAANAILDLLVGRDVPAFVDAPLYAYRGTTRVGPGRVQLGRRLPGESLGVSDAERTAAASVLSGRTVGIVGPWAPGPKEPADIALARGAIETALGALGATTTQCSYAKNAKAAVACMTEMVSAGVAAIVVLGGTANLGAAAKAAIDAGIPVFGSDAAYLGDTGAIYVELDDRAIGRLQGRMAGVYVENELTDNTAVYAAVLNATGATGRDPVADAIERSANLASGDLTSIGRFKSSQKSAKAGVIAALTQVPLLKVLLGPFAARAAGELKSIKNPRPPKDMVIFGLRCTDAMKDQIAAGGRIQACVDVDVAGAGTLLVDAMARVFAGGTVPGLIDVPVKPFPADAATLVGEEIPG